MYREDLDTPILSRSLRGLRIYSCALILDSTSLHYYHFIITSYSEIIWKSFQQREASAESKGETESKGEASKEGETWKLEAGVRICAFLQV